MNTNNNIVMAIKQIMRNDTHSGTINDLIDGNIKQRASMAVCNAVKCGVLIRPTMCSNCKCDNKRIIAHHADYRFYLQVEWLCNSCHRLIHHDLGDVKSKEEKMSGYITDARTYLENHKNDPPELTHIDIANILHRAEHKHGA